MRLLIDSRMENCEKLCDFLNGEFIYNSVVAVVSNVSPIDSLIEVEETVYLSQDYVTAEKLIRNGKCCIYVQQDPLGEFASGIKWIMTDPIEITEDYVWKVYDHFVGRPHVIGADNILELRESIPEDFDVLCAGGSAGVMEDYNDILSDREAFESYISNAYELYGFGYWTVIERKSGKVAGWAGFSPSTDDDYSHAEIGYMILPAYRRKGYAVRSIEICVSYGFEELDLKEIAARIMATNEASAAAARKAGFKLAKEDVSEAGERIAVYFKIID